MVTGAEQIRSMFDSISPAYDLLNRLLSFGRDMRWRKRAAAAIGFCDGDYALDLACGTGDMITAIRAFNGKCRIVGADFSQRMLALCKKKVRAEIVAADACALPFKDAVFDKVTMVFGFRNVMDKPLALSELFRVLKSGGRVAILEFSKPNFLFSHFFLFYFRFVLPRIGAVLSGHKRAYSYLPESVMRFPDEAEYRKMLEKAGFSDICFTPYDFGICTVAMAVKTS